MFSTPQYTGTSLFGRAYRVMMENDAHAAGSVDRELTARMIRLCPQTAVYLYDEYTPVVSRYRAGARPELERCVREATAGGRSSEERIEGIAGFTAALAERVDDEGLDATILGGTAERIVERGSDWCTDVARVACVLCQVAGIPARMVYLFDTAQAYSAHVIIEAHRRGTWGAVDSSTDVVYRHRGGAPASTWELTNDLGLVESHYRDESTLYTRAGQFRAAAVVNYFAWERRKYDFTTSGLNDYYRSILEMAGKGWPGGLKWLHGEDDGAG